MLWFKLHILHDLWFFISCFCKVRRKHMAFLHLFCTGVGTMGTQQVGIIIVWFPYVNVFCWNIRVDGHVKIKYNMSLDQICLYHEPQSCSYCIPWRCFYSSLSLNVNHYFMTPPYCLHFYFPCSPCITDNLWAQYTW